MATIVRVHNNGTTPVKLAWDGEKWVIKPGEDEYVSMEAAVLAFGDPYLTNSATDPLRTKEYERIRTLHGIYSDDDKLHHFPDVSVFTAKGEPLNMVMHDPEGLALPGDIRTEQVSVDSSLATITARLDQLAAENAALTEELRTRTFAAAQAAAAVPVIDAGPMLPAPASEAHPSGLTEDQLAELDGLTIEEMTARINAAAVAKADEHEPDATPAALGEDAPPKSGGRKLAKG